MPESNSNIHVSSYHYLKNHSFSLARISLTSIKRVTIHH